MAELHGDEFSVYVCPVHTDRSVVAPFDEALSDFTRILITDSLRSDPSLDDAIDAVTQRFRAGVPTPSQAERAEYRTLYWQSLAPSSVVLLRLETQFRAAQTRGRLRCRLCERCHRTPTTVHVRSLRSRPPGEMGREDISSVTA